MKEICIFKFPKNGAKVSVSYWQPPHKDKRVKDDCLWLQWQTEEKEKLGIGMRPDEALLIAEMLVEGVRVITEMYKTSRPIKDYRIKKR